MTRLTPLATCPSCPQNRLASLTNKCHGDEDLEYYVMEAGHILGLKLPDNANAKVGPQVLGLHSGGVVGLARRMGLRQGARLCAEERFASGVRVCNGRWCRRCTEVGSTRTRSWSTGHPPPCERASIFVTNSALAGFVVPCHERPVVDSSNVRYITRLPVPLALQSAYPHLLPLPLLPPPSSPQHVLSEVFRRISQYKMGSLGLGQTLDSMGQTLPAANQFGDQFEL